MSRSTPRALPLGAVLVAALLVPGCLQPSPTVIKAGSQTVTVADFERAARTAQGQYGGSPEVARALLTDDMLKRTLMLEYAHRMGHDTAAAAQNIERDELRRTLVQNLYMRAASPTQRVSEAEAQELYEARKQQAHVLLIYTTNKQTAESALARLRAGEPFEQVSQTLSLPGLLPPDGDMGMVAPGSLPDPLDRGVRSLPVGELGGPYETREGWFVMKIKERAPREQGTYEALRAGMYDLARQRKQRAAFNRTYTDMKAEYQFAFVPGGPQLLFRITSPVEPLKPTPEQLKTPLASFVVPGVGQVLYTLADAMHDLEDANVQRPPYQLLPAIEIWIEAQCMTRVAVYEGRRRHLHEESDMATSIKAKRDGFLLEGVYGLATANVPPPSSDLIQEAWDQVKSRYTHVEDVKLAYVDIPDSNLVMKFVGIAQQQAQPSLAEAAQAVDPSLVIHQVTIRNPAEDPQWAPLAALFTQMAVTGMAGPEAVPGGYRIMQLLDKKMVQQTLEQLPEATRMNVLSAAAEMARDARFRQFADSLFKAYQPYVDRAAIQRVKLPTAAAAGMAVPMGTPGGAPGGN